MEKPAVSISSINALAFYREVAANGTVWAIRDENGFPAPVNSDGKRAMPFWSLKSRALAVVGKPGAYKGFEPIEIGWQTFYEKWVPGLTRDGLLAGLNWNGASATGFDITPTELLRNVKAAMDMQ